MFMEMVAFIQTGSTGFTRLREIRLGCVLPVIDGVSAPQNTFHDTQSLKAPLQKWLGDLYNDPDYRRASVCIQAMIRSKPQDRPSARTVLEEIHAPSA